MTVRELQEKLKLLDPAQKVALYQSGSVARLVTQVKILDSTEKLSWVDISRPGSKFAVLCHNEFQESSGTSKIMGKESSK